MSPSSPLPRRARSDDIDHPPGHIRSRETVASPAPREPPIPSPPVASPPVLRVVADTDDCGKVDPGDVIAIPYSDVGWTPLFARARSLQPPAGCCRTAASSPVSTESPVSSLSPELCS